MSAPGPARRLGALVLSVAVVTVAAWYALSKRGMLRIIAVTVAVLTPESTHRETRVVFLGGQLGRGRAPIAASAILLSRLR